MARPAFDADRRLVPVTVIAGYLGAGKTTVVNHLLAEPRGRRLAVLVNDFGALDVDARLIAAQGANTVSLSNGCVCCSIADALGDGLDEVLALDPPPEQIVIEASGVADPAKIAVYGQGWPGLRLDAVVTVVDATSMEANAADRFVGSLVVRQLVAADVVLLSKTDLIDATALDAARRWLGARVGQTPVLAMRHGRVPAALVLDVSADHLGAPATSSTVSADHLGAPAASSTAGAATAGPATGGATVVRSTAGADASADTPGLGPAADDGEEFRSTVIRLERPVERSALEDALDNWPDAVVRVKGFVRIAESGEQTYEVQRVGRRWTIDMSDDRDAPSALVLVVIPGRADQGVLRPEELSRNLLGS